MKAKLETSNEVPKEWRSLQTETLSNNDLAELTQTSRAHCAFFNPILHVRKLLHYVTRGEHTQVKAMLNKDINLIFKLGKVTDCSGREFENISGFEYALWALDKHMWATMIACIPQDEEGKKVFARLYAQYNKVNTDGVTYRLNGKTITEQHFDFENTIIKELKVQVNPTRKMFEEKEIVLHIEDWKRIANQLIQGVGAAQKLLPVHAVHEYCSDRPFYPVPDFVSPPKPSQQFLNFINLKMEHWFEKNSDLSISFALCKASTLPVCSVHAKGDYKYQAKPFEFDLAAMEKLREVRQDDFIRLESELVNSMTPELIREPTKPCII